MRPEWLVLIADDEPAARRGVRQMLAPWPEFAVAGECRDGSEVLASLDALRPDVVFLDVQMPGMDGFEVIRRRTAERMPLTVFLTAFDQHAIRAFDAQALDYLVKPVSETRFGATMRRLRRLLGQPLQREHFVVTTPRGRTVVRLDDVEWIESADNYARLWSGGRSYLVREPLRSLEGRVRPHGFIRAHRRALVRLDCVQALRPNGEGGLIVVLRGGGEIPVARRRRAAFTRAIRPLRS